MLTEHLESSRLYNMYNSIVVYKISDQTESLNIPTENNSKEICISEWRKLISEKLSEKIDPNDIMVLTVKNFTTEDLL